MKEFTPFFLSGKEWFISIIDWIELHSDLVTAAATIAIAAFTFTLWWTTRKLWKASEQQSRDVKESLRIAQESADAARESADALPAIERAYLFVKVVLVEPKDLDPDEPRVRIGNEKLPGVNRVNIIITNHGKTPAILEEIIISNNKFFTEGFYLLIPFGTDIIESGEQKIYSTVFFVHGEKEWQEIVNGNDSLLLEGVIRYTDVWVISHDAIHFCWQYNDFINKFRPCPEIKRNYRVQKKD